MDNLDIQHKLINQMMYIIMDTTHMNFVLLWIKHVSDMFIPW
jgi:hypothetical protein